MQAIAHPLVRVRGPPSPPATCCQRRDRRQDQRRKAMKFSKLILTVSFLAVSIILNSHNVFAEATHSGQFSIALTPDSSLVLYTDFTNEQRDIALTVCNDKSSTVPVQISADGAPVLAVGASNCRTVVVKAVTLSMSVLSPGIVTGTYLVSVELKESRFGDQKRK
jgi:hypothetical protein